MEAKVIKIDIDRASGEDVGEAIAKAVADAIGKEIEGVIEAGDRPSDSPVYKKALELYRNHRMPLHLTISKMIREDEPVDNIMALIFSIAFKEGYDCKGAELEAGTEDENDREAEGKSVHRETPVCGEAE